MAFTGLAGPASTSWSASLWLITVGGLWLLGGLMMAWIGGRKGTTGRIWKRAGRGSVFIVGGPVFMALGLIGLVAHL